MAIEHADFDGIERLALVTGARLCLLCCAVLCCAVLCAPWRGGRYGGCDMMCISCITLQPCSLPVLHSPIL